MTEVICNNPIERTTPQLSTTILNELNCPLKHWMIHRVFRDDVDVERLKHAHEEGVARDRVAATPLPKMLREPAIP